MSGWDIHVIYVVVATVRTKVLFLTYIADGLNLSLSSSCPQRSTVHPAPQLPIAPSPIAGPHRRRLGPGRAGWRLEGEISGKRQIIYVKLHASPIVSVTSSHSPSPQLSLPTTFLQNHPIRMLLRPKCDVKTPLNILLGLLNLWGMGADFVTAFFFFECRVCFLVCIWKLTVGDSLVLASSLYKLYISIYGIVPDLRTILYILIS